ncbi:protein FAR1-RELATED SEQUENCE 5-like [Apium graveolens]|uniref:protein FAR1-RELATED SEQUENCE 5-like n=1 Tax=Apium graveolens TaxID=4045 RepID=UPI003D79E99C
MRDKLKTTSKWVLGTWLDAIEGKELLAIITDQDQVMAGQFNLNYRTPHICGVLDTLVTNFSKSFKSILQRMNLKDEHEMLRPPQPLLVCDDDKQKRDAGSSYIFIGFFVSSDDGITKNMGPDEHEMLRPPQPPLVCDDDKAYALRNEFAIKIQASHRNKDNEIYGRLYVCRLYEKSFVAESSQNKRRREVLPKSECKVRMYVNYQKKKHHWEVTSLELVHNHGLVSPSKMNLVQRERHINTATHSLIKTLYGSRVRNCQVMNGIGKIHGGNEKVGFNVQHVRNVLRDERKKRFEISDAQAGLDLFHRLNEESGSKYFIRTEVDEENRLKCLVWIDPRCIMAYQNFGDVMAFNTTYRTNRYAMPFVPFTGVNHHYQSVIFGFALMRDEHTSTFEWILRTWLEGVGNNPPLTIITDQDQAMVSAIAVVLPNTTHLLCSWHISQKFPEKLAHYYSAFLEFKTYFNHCIYKSLTECVFEARWASFVEKYHING